MPDELYSLIAIASAVASVLVLWLRFRQQRLFRRFLKSLSEDQLRELRKQLQKQDDNRERAESPN